MAKKHQPNLFPFIVFSFFVIIALVVFWQQTPFSSLRPQTTKTPATTPISPPVPTGWTIYKNDQYRFSFAHPPETQVIKHMEGHPMSIDGFFVTGFERSLWVYKTNCDPTCFQQQIIDWWPKTKLDGKPITINGVQGYLINFDANPDGNGPVRREIYLRSDQGTVIYFEFPYLQSVDAPLHYNQQKMLDSFIFF